MLSPALLSAGRPSWLPRADNIYAAIYADFVNGNYWSSGGRKTDFGTWIAALSGTLTRATTAYRTNATGLLESVASGALRFDYNPSTLALKGILLEGVHTNVVLWNRDLTNAVWTASNVTVAKNQTGADGSANSASSLTASAGNGTVLQAITLASSARYQSAYVKRLTGSGTINMTMDNGSTWTAIVPTSAWTRLVIPTQTLANPTVGFRIVTSGDAIAVDFVQNEDGTIPTSPIATTTVAVARNSDVLKFLTSVPAPFSIYGKFIPGSITSVDWFNTQTSLANGVGAYASTTIGFVRESSATTAAVDCGGGAITVGASNKVAIRAAVNDFNVAANGTKGTADASCTPPTMTQFNFSRSAYGFGGNWLDGCFSEMAIYPIGVSDAELQRITQ